MPHFPLTFNNTKGSQNTTQNWCLILDHRLSFKEYLKTMVAKLSKAIALLRKLQHILQNFYSPLSRIRICSLRQGVQCLPRTSISRDFYLELIIDNLSWLTSSQQRRRHRKLRCLYNEKSPDIFFQLMHPQNHHCICLEALAIFHSSKFIKSFSEILFSLSTIFK